MKARIIPCVAVRHGRTVKGVGFEQMEDVGDPVEQALRYAYDGAHELVWLDIAATVDDKAVSVQQIAQLRQDLKIPLTVGGGVRTLDDVYTLLSAGADKVSINSAALETPDLIDAVARRWGSQCVVVAVDAKRVDRQYQVFSHGGRRAAGITLGDWLAEAQSRGAGEFLVTSIDTDGRQQGYDHEMLEFAMRLVNRPLIASGGAGSIDHMVEMMEQGCLSLLLASLLHRGQTTVSELKRALAQRGFPIRV